MLRNTGDKNIDLLWQILDKIMDIKEEIHVSQPKNDTTEDFENEFDDENED